MDEKDYPDIIKRNILRIKKKWDDMRIYFFSHNSYFIKIRLMSHIFDFINNRKQDVI